MKNFLTTLLISILTLTMGIAVSAAGDLTSMEFNVQAVRRMAGETIHLTILPTPKSVKLSNVTITYTSENPEVSTMIKRFTDAM